MNDFVSPYRVLLDKVSKPTLYVTRLKAIATEAYTCFVNENPKYINVMFDPVTKPYFFSEEAHGQNSQKSIQHVAA